MAGTPPLSRWEHTLQPRFEAQSEVYCVVFGALVPRGKAEFSHLGVDFDPCGGRRHTLPEAPPRGSAQRRPGSGARS